MDNQIILACDDQGNFLEYISRAEGHTGKGRRHLAITVLVYNNKGEVLLQRRKHEVFDNIWDFTASTHPLHTQNGTDETLEQATLRALKYEYDIENISVKRVGEFNYFAPYHHVVSGTWLCENEHCFLLIGEYNGQLKLNKDVGYEYKWVGKQEFSEDINKNPKKYSPWAVEGFKLLKEELLDISFS